MATPDRFAAQLDALEEQLAGLGDRLEVTRTQAREAAEELAKLEADRAAGMAVPDWKLDQARLRAAGGEAGGDALAGMSAGLAETFSRLEDLGQAGAELAPELRELAGLVEQVATAERERAEATADVERVERKLASLAVGTSGHAAAEQELASARTRQREAESKVTVLGREYSRAETTLTQRVQKAEAAQPGALTRAASLAGQAYAAPEAGAGKLAQGAQAALSPASAVTGAFGDIGGMLAQFVSAFDPSTVMMFQQALNDLTAVIGQALSPVLQVLTEVARDVAAVLNPIGQQLAPIFGQLARTIASVLVPLIEVWAGVLQDLVPVFKVLADVVAAVSPVLRLYSAFLSGVIEQLRQWITALLPTGDTIKSWTDQLADAFQELAKGALIVTAYFARLVGATGFLDGMLKSLKGQAAERKDATGLGAPQQARVGGLLDWERQQMTNAFMATGGGLPAKKTEDWLADAVRALEEIKAGNDRSVDQIKEAIGAGVDRLTGWLRDYLDQKLRELKQNVTEDVLDKAGHVAAWTIGGPVGAAYLAWRASEGK